MAPPPASKYGSARANHSEFAAWRDARWRCSKKNCKSWKSYGGRGIKMCQRWRKAFGNFLDDMGPKPSRGLSLDRRDNNGHYSCGRCHECKENKWPANCRWATDNEQRTNQRPRTNPTPKQTTYNGESK